MQYQTKYPTAIGWLWISGTERFIESIEYLDAEPQEVSKEIPSIFKRLLAQLDLYFLEGKWEFDVPLQPQGTDFQRRVWDELEKIPFGNTISYLELAKRLGDEKVIRAAASANGKNPISILIPCHRVIGKDGSLTGYAGGLHRKEFLLNLEGALGGKQLELFQL